MLVLICCLYLLNTVVAFFVSMMTKRWLTGRQSSDLTGKIREKE
jgi:antirestriction protein ArdC